MSSDVERLNKEAEAFDLQTEERAKSGHIPDLRRAQSCHYFYNNAWREPEYVALDFGEQFELIMTTLNRYILKPSGSISILEVGCGPGYLSLELARNGYSVIGVDLSPKSIAVANKTANDDPWKELRGGLQYICADFLSDNFLNRGFDAVIFLGTLHHFQDQDRVMLKVMDMLKDDGIVLAHEPARDRVTESNASVVYLIRTLLSASNGFFQKEPIPSNKEQLHERMKTISRELRYEDVDGNKIQSVNDNEAGYDKMVQSLDSHFNRLQCDDRYAFFHEIIGGLRFDHETNVALARYLRDIDAIMCRLGMIKATEFIYVGRKRSD
jgi:2-polyprenyl-3-methyl-5-hydroxy-6-metoxy-1,4-benzoquinol methylase